MVHLADTLMTTGFVLSIMLKIFFINIIIIIG